MKKYLCLIIPILMVLSIISFPLTSNAIGPLTIEGYTVYQYGMNLGETYGYPASGVEADNGSLGSGVWKDMNSPNGSVTFKVNSEMAGNKSVKIRHWGIPGSIGKLYINGSFVMDFFPKADWTEDTYSTKPADMAAYTDVYLNKGENTIKIESFSGGFSVNYFAVENSFSIPGYTVYQNGTDIGEVTYGVPAAGTEAADGAFGTGRWKDMNSPNGSVTFKVNSEMAGNKSVKIRHTGIPGSIGKLYINGSFVMDFFPKAGWTEDTYSTKPADMAAYTDVYLSKGENTIKIESFSGGFSVNYFAVENSFNIPGYTVYQSGTDIGEVTYTDTAIGAEAANGAFGTGVWTYINSPNGSVTFKVNSEMAGNKSVKIRHTGIPGSIGKLYINGSFVMDFFPQSSWTEDTYSTKPVDKDAYTDVYLNKGENTITISAFSGGFTTNYFAIENVAGDITSNIETGTYEEAQTVILTGSGYTGAEIYYTLDGSDPTDASIKYTGAITIEQTTTLKVAEKYNGKYGNISTYTYTINAPKFYTVTYYNNETETQNLTEANRITVDLVENADRIPVLAVYKDNSLVNVSVGLKGATFIKIGKIPQGAVVKLISLMDLSTLQPLDNVQILLGQ